MKKTTILLLIATAVALMVTVTPGVAMANFAIHGNYVMDTEACAGCHRAHTAVSSITWTNSDTVPQQKNALLISTASETYQLCYVCHDSAGQGADTDVQSGVYRGTLYGTPNATLNGGGFDSVGGVAVTSKHIETGASWAAYGGGNYGVPIGSVLATGNAVGQVGTGNLIKMGCDTCHDPHGSSNYRILKDNVNGVTVGGYSGDENTPDPNPNPFVISAEVGYPIGGFRLHQPYTTYKPNFTTAQYAKGPGNDPTKGMSAWCSGCHTAYLTQDSVGGTVYNANDRYGLTTRHRHPINVALSNFKPVSRALVIGGTNTLPLDHDASEAGGITNQSSDWIECLTCHAAHGSSAVMTGFANVVDSTNPQKDTGGGGVAPTDHSALLRLNNRGVCEVCHNK